MVTPTALEELLEYCGADGRICPMPDAWNGLYLMINRIAERRGVEVPFPLILGGWDSSNEAKTIRFREHLELAASLEILPQVSQYIKKLDESEWFHHTMRH